MTPPDDMQSIPVFVVSLRRAQDRRALMSRQLREAGLNFEIVDGVDGNAISAQDLEALTVPGKVFHPGVIGCYLSHTNIYKKIVDEAIEVALILEDDAVLNSKVISLIKRGLPFQDFDYLYLDCDNPVGQQIFYDRKSLINMPNGLSIYKLHAGPCTLHAYFISNVGARKRLDHLFPIRQAIDVYTALPYEPIFFAFNNPRAASINELSRTSATSKRDDTKRGPLKFRYLRKSPTFHNVVQWLKTNHIQVWLERRRLVQTGVLARDGDWRAMPKGRAIVST